MRVSPEQCGGQGWTGATVCPSGWTCTVSNQYYSQCLPGAAAPTAPSSTPTVPTNPGGGGSPTSTASAPGSLPTLVSGNSFIRAVVCRRAFASPPHMLNRPLSLSAHWQEAPNFHQYLRSEVAGTASDAVLGDYTTASQFQIVGGQLIQEVADGSKLYAVVEGRADPSVMKLKMSWSTAPASGANAGTFQWSGDTVEWSIPTIQRPQLNVCLCALNLDVFSERSCCICAGVARLPRRGGQQGRVHQLGPVLLQHPRRVRGRDDPRVHGCDTHPVIMQCKIHVCSVLAYDHEKHRDVVLYDCI